MTWRTVCITKRAKLDLRMNHLIVRMEDDTFKIHLGEMQSLMIETTQVSITTALLAELSKQKIRVIICDEKHNPLSELLPYYGCHDCSKKIRLQTTWDKDFQKELWKMIVYHKIKNQKELMISKSCGSYYIDLLEKYLFEIEPNDETNREGLAAKVYFAGLFGQDFIRGQNDVLNAALDYGYQIILSCFNREIKSCGYLTEIGIHHQNQHNYFNLSSDLMEPFRPIVDKAVFENNMTQFGKEEKYLIQKLIHDTVTINNRKQVLSNAIGIYTKSILEALHNKDMGYVRWLEYEV